MDMSRREFSPEVEKLFDDAIASRDSGDLEAAVEKFSSFIGKCPDFGPAYTLKGAILDDLGLLDEAIVCFRKGVELKPLSELASLALYHALWDTGDRRGALAEMGRFFAAGGISKDYDEMLDEIEELLKSVQDETASEE